MRNSMNRFCRRGVAALALTAVIGCFALQAEAGTVENMERERAILIETLRAADLEANERAGKVEISRHRLVDLERMVLRDDSLAGREIFRLLAGELEDAEAQQRLDVAPGPGQAKRQRKGQHHRERRAGHGQGVPHAARAGYLDPMTHTGCARVTLAR